MKSIALMKNGDWVEIQTPSSRWINSGSCAAHDQGRHYALWTMAPSSPSDTSRISIGLLSTTFPSHGWFSHWTLMDTYQIDTERNCHSPLLMDQKVSHSAVCNLKHSWTLNISIGHVSMPNATVILEFFTPPWLAPSLSKLLRIFIGLRKTHKY